MAEVAMFVYGTLRPGQWNHSGDGEVRPPMEGCTIEGRIYFVWDNSGYPVAKLDEEGRIIGDVLFLDDESSEYESIVRMERGAGYEPRDVAVRIEDEDGTVREFGAVAWHYIDKPRGELIRSGDWHREYLTNVFRD
jgi:gamma-glutamylcyclotransferase (GGCT)/AIG2-like uncharacterized protein YtfP